MSTKEEMHIADEKGQRNEEVKAQVEEQLISSEATSKILDRSLFTHRQYMFLVVGIMIQAFLYTFENNLMYNCQGAIVASFEKSSLISILPVILQTMSAALVPFYVKVSDVVGRAQSLTFSMVFYLIGYTIQGTANGFTQFALGQIAYGIGSTGMLTIIQILIADTTRLINRGIMIALWDLPSAINVFTTQPLTDPLTDTVKYPNANWRNVYAIDGALAVVGSIAILTPLWYLQLKYQKKGRKAARKTIGWLLHEYDAIGALLITAGMSMTLLPMILARTYEKNWNDPRVIGMMTSGLFCLVLLVLWEAKFTDKPIMPMRIWVNRTCFGGLIVGFFMTVMASMNWQYYTQYLVVSRDITFGRAILLERGYNVTYLVFELATGLLMKRLNRYRPFLWVGIVVYTTGLGLMIKSRQPTSSDFFIVFSQIVVGAAGGMSHIASTVAVTGAVDRKDVAVVIGVMQILGSFGSAFGGALAGGIWTQYLPSRLHHYVTGPYDENLAMNSPAYVQTLDPTTKHQVIEAFSESQKLMSIIAMTLGVFVCLCTFLMQPVDLSKDQSINEEDKTTKDENKDSDSDTTMGGENNKSMEGKEEIEVEKERHDYA
ncbi:hypothetical protein BGZ49_002073 [Haplosporangium sp. Z 27]|nr:hypothetical protein BGZ49_002073 [Haplosporangium sp. Z 27]